MRRWKACLLVGGLPLAAMVSFVCFVHFVCIPALERRLEDAPRVKAVQIQHAVETYYAIHGKYPDRLEDITKPDSELGNRAYLQPDQILDPWGKPYQAEFPTDEGGKVRIWTTTPNGEKVSYERKH
jgi:hypothetical protein